MTPSVLPVASRALLAACRALGLDAGAIAARAGVEERALGDPDARLPAAAADALWREAYGAADDPALALHAAERTPPGAFRVLDHLAATGATVGDALRAVAAYFPLVDPRGALAASEEPGGRVALRFEGAGGVPLPAPAQEYTLAILVGRVRHLLGAEWRPLEVRLALPRPTDASEYARVLGVEPRFGAPAAALVLSRADWDCPVPSRDPGLFAALDLHARGVLRRLAAPPALADRVREVVDAGPPGREPALDAVARRLGTSRRSLQRALAREGTSFAAVVDAWRAERAQALLRSPDVSIAEASWLLGFSEQGAFGRAFRRWTGASPTEWRRGGGG